MTAAYRTFARTLTSTPQSEPIFGSSQVPNSAGGYSYKVDKWTQLERFLIMGSEGGTYYIGEKKLTKDNAKNVLACIKEDGVRVVNALHDVSTAGRAPSNDPALFVLALAASYGDDVTRANALQVLPAVARIGTHLMHFADYVDGMRGWGRGLRKAVANWYQSQSLQHLELNVVKYQSRDKWSNRDLLRLSHPKTSDPVRNAIYKWVVDGAESILENPRVGSLPLVASFELLKLNSTPEYAAELIRDYGLPREAIPTELQNVKEVQEALLGDVSRPMPLTAMIRNLGNMTKSGLLAPFNDPSKFVISQLGNDEALRKARVHPMQIFLAARQYAAGHGLRGSNSWTPVGSIQTALDKAFYAAFKNVEPTNKNIVLGIDVSGSMRSCSVNGMDTVVCSEAAVVQAAIFASTEPNVQTVLFDMRTKNVHLAPGSSIADVNMIVGNFGGGGTDVALPIEEAIKNGWNVDAFILLTDSETWAGREHPQQTFDKYRKQFNPRAKMVVISMAANEYSVGDTDDTGVLQVAGLDTSVPQVVAEFIK